MNYKIINGSLLLSSDSGLYISRDTLYIVGGKIAAIGNPPPSPEEYTTYDAEGLLIMPGLINMHTHAYMSAMRNYADDIPFDTWLFGKIDPAENKLNTEAAYYSSLFGITEMIKTGTTAFLDMHMFEGASAKAAQDSGIRGFIGRGLVGDSLAEGGAGRFAEALAEREKYECDRIKFLLSPHAIYTCGTELLREINAEAKRLGMLKQIHLAESDFEGASCMEKHGKTPVELLSSLGFLDEKTILAHCVKLTPGDIKIIADSGASVVTNPASNAKLGNGFAPIPRLISAGVNVCIGTDSMASNNTLNMFREMSLLSLLHKAVEKSSVTMSAEEVLRLATENAALALGLENKLGKIKVGAYADLAFIDLNSTSLFPNNNIISSLCYSANGTEVHSLMVEGKFLMKNKEMLTIDTERVYFEVNRAVKSFS